MMQPESPAQLGGKIYDMMKTALLSKWGSSADAFQQQVSTPETVEAEVVDPAEAGGQDDTNIGMR